MKKIVSTIILLLAFTLPLFAQDNNVRYIEVTGSSETEVIPDEIHFIIQIREYWKEEFEKKNKPENYKTKVPLSEIEKNLMQVLQTAGIRKQDIHIQQIGDYWREEGKDFLISKNFDITVKDFGTIDKIVKNIDTKGIQTMRIGELKNKNIADYRIKGKIAALKAAKSKAESLTSALGKQLGDVLRITEIDDKNQYFFQPQISLNSNISFTEDNHWNNFRTIKLRYEMTVRFEIR